MRLDWECARAILTALEELPTSEATLHPGALRTWDEETVSHHMQLFGEAGLIQIRDRTRPGEPIFCVATDLKWEGHKLLDCMRGETAWNGVRRLAHELGLPLTLDVIKVVWIRYLGQIVKGG